ncbi:MAG: NUDIX hydrolase [Pseudomonadales bacterium]|nr:NUDIX hydrolase [Pseudomonadales bacterium]
MNFCTECGAQVVQRIPDLDDRLRHVCVACGMIHYQNPKVIVGLLPTWQGKVLLCKRAIEPRLGKWTLPAGFMENGEAAEQGARRETMEEAGAAIAQTYIYREFDIPAINQIYLFYRGEMASADFCAGVESLEVALFDEADIPWHELAFPVMSDILAEYFEDRRSGVFGMRSGEPNYLVLAT